MIRILRLLLVVSMVVAPLVAQPTPSPGQQQRFNSRLNQIMERSDTEPQTNNYQLEISMTRGGSTARYRVALSGGQVSTEFLDKLAKGDSLMINLNASLNPFEGGAEATLFLGRPYAWKSKVLDKGSGEEKEVINVKSMGLTTKVALTFGKAVLIYDDEDEKISVKLTQL